MRGGGENARAKSGAADTRFRCSDLGHDPGPLHSRPRAIFRATTGSQPLRNGEWSVGTLPSRNPVGPGLLLLTHGVDVAQFQVQGAPAVGASEVSKPGVHGFSCITRLPDLLHSGHGADGVSSTGGLYWLRAV